jgi:hypothetical protein
MRHPRSIPSQTSVLHPWNQSTIVYPLVPIHHRISVGSCPPSYICWIISTIVYPLGPYPQDLLCRSMEGSQQCLYPLPTSQSTRHGSISLRSRIASSRTAFATEGSTAGAAGTSVRQRNDTTNMIMMITIASLGVAKSILGCQAAIALHRTPHRTTCSLG